MGKQIFQTIRNMYMHTYNIFMISRLGRSSWISNNKAQFIKENIDL